MSEGTLPGIESTPTSTPALTPAGAASDSARGTVADSTSRLYGRMPLSLDEFMDILEQAAQVPGSSVGFMRLDLETGTRRNVAPIRVEDFDSAAMVRRFGGGEYFARISQPGRRAPFRCCKIILESLEPSAPSNSLPPAPAHTTPPSGAGGFSTTSDDMFKLLITMMMENTKQAQAQAVAQQEQTTRLFTAMLERKDSPRGIGELEGIIKLMDHLERRRGGDEGGSSDVIERVTAGLVDGLLNHQPATKPPTPQPTRPAVTTVTRPAPVALPPAPPQPTATTDPSSSATGTSPAAGSSAPTANPVDLEKAQEPTVSLNLSIGQKIRAMGAIQLLQQVLPQPDNKPEDIAEAVADALGDDLVTSMIDATTPGQISTQLVQAQPSLAAHQERLILVESALRELYTETDEESDKEP